MKISDYNFPIKQPLILFATISQYKLSLKFILIRKLWQLCHEYRCENAKILRESPENHSLSHFQIVSQITLVVKYDSKNFESISTLLIIRRWEEGVI